MKKLVFKQNKNNKLELYTFRLLPPSYLSVKAPPRANCYLMSELNSLEGTNLSNLRENSVPFTNQLTLSYSYLGFEKKSKTFPAMQET